MPALELDWPFDKPLLVACSGGSDSLALLCLLCEQGRCLEVAYLDHGERPHPAEFLRTFCQNKGIVFHTRRLRVQRWTKRLGLSWEAAARYLRYHWLMGLAKARSALLLTAHTLDDQAETVLLRLITGTSLSGLSAIQAGIPGLARPLLGWTRAELQAWLRQHGQQWIEDPENYNPRFPRVRIRHEVIPVLTQINAGVMRHLARLAQDAAELGSLLSQKRSLRLMTRIEFEEFLHRSWTELDPPVGVRFSREQTQEIYQALHRSDWACWNLPGHIWAEWDGQRFSLGKPVALPELAPPGCVWRFRQPGDRWLGRSLKKMMNAWRVPRRARDHLPLLVRATNEVMAVLGFAVQTEVAAWASAERSGLLLVEAETNE